MPTLESSDDKPSLQGFKLEGPLVFETVSGMVDSLPTDVDKLVIDLSKVTEVDSSALALFLEWQRIAESRNVSLEFINWSENMKSLLNLYNLNPILTDASPASQ